MAAAAIGAAGVALAVVPGAVAQTSASSSSPQAQAASPLAAPMSDMDKRIAADLLFKRLLIKPDDLDAGFRYAELETELSDYEAAIGALGHRLINRNHIRMAASLTRAR
jgi:hypothetical protein